MAEKARKPDGRLGRSERSRAAVAEALLALVEEGDLRPTAPRIAARAGVSLRLVFHHFKDLEAVFAEASRRQLERVIPTLRTVPAEGALADRIGAFVAERTRLYENVGTTWRAACLQEPFSTEISRRMGIVRTYLRAEIERVFAKEIAKAKPAERKALIAQLSAAASMSHFTELRDVESLSADDARRVMARALTDRLR
jgi:TetR/AcrR family transcriptional regulator, regulator of autoinduction and epiphytic fitness